MRDQQVWVTGARGFIGRHLVRDLVRDGIMPAGLGHGRPNVTEPDWRVEPWVNGEIALSNLDLLQRAKGLPEIIYHLAGGSSVGPSLAAPLEDFERTVIATACLLEWLRTRAPNCKLVLVSSAAVYGSNPAVASADAMLRPLSPYGTHKLVAEQLLRGSGSCWGLQSAIVRFFSVYGEGLTKQLFFDLCRRLSLNPAVLELGGTGNELRDWLHVADATRQLRAAADFCSPTCPTFDGGTGSGTRVADAVTHLCHAWGSKAEVRFSGIVRAGDPPQLVATGLRMEGIAEPPYLPLAEGLGRYVAWYRGQVGNP